MVIDALLTPLLTAAAPVAPCDLSDIDNAAALQIALGARAVEMVRLSRASDARSTFRLERLVAPDAVFTLGAGDVGRAMGKGTTGARKLAAQMHATGYRYLGWDYMAVPTNACTEHKITVEFTDLDARLLSSVEFTFDRGVVTSAKGWSRSFISGSL